MSLRVRRKAECDTRYEGGRFLEKMGQGNRRSTGASAIKVTKAMLRGGCRETCETSHQSITTLPCGGVANAATEVRDQKQEKATCRGTASLSVNATADACTGRGTSHGVRVRGRGELYRYETYTLLFCSLFSFSCVTLLLSLFYHFFRQRKSEIIGVFRFTAALQTRQHPSWSRRHEGRHLQIALPFSFASAVSPRRGVARKHESVRGEGFGLVLRRASCCAIVARLDE